MRQCVFYIIGFLFFLSAQAGTQEKYADAGTSREKKTKQKHDWKSVTLLFNLKDEIGESKYNILQNAESIRFSEIVLKKIENTENEYGRILEEHKNVAVEEAFDLLHHFKEDCNYMMSVKTTTVFDPRYQIEMSYQEEKLYLMIDMKHSMVSYINNEGQVLLEVSDQLIVWTNNFIDKLKAE